MSKNKKSKLSSRRGAPPFRRGEKSSDIRVGIGNDGNPAIFVNIGGKIYSTPLFLVGLGGQQTSLSVKDINVENDIVTSKNGKFVNLDIADGVVSIKKKSAEHDEALIMQNGDAQMYVDESNNIVFSLKVGGVTHYKSMDLTGTGGGGWDDSDDGGDGGDIPT